MGQYEASLMTYESHNITDSPLDMKTLNTLNPHQVALGTKLWEQNESAVRLHDFPDLIQAAQQDTVDLGRRNHAVLHEQSRSLDQFMDLLLGRRDILWRLSSDEYFLRIPALGTGMTVSIDLRKRRREINSRICRRFNVLDVLPRAATDDGV